MLKRFAIAGVVVLIFGISLVLVGRLFSESEVILGKVGDTVITKGDFEEFLQRNMSLRRNRPYSPQEKTAMLDNLVRATVIASEAEKDKLDESPGFKSKMKLYRIEVLVQEYFAKIQPTIKVTDEEAEEIMKDHPALLPKETLMLKEILVKTEKEAESIYETLQKATDKSGEFAKTAVEKSIADSRVNGGSMRPVSRGFLPKPIEEVAFSLQKGELSKPIKTEKGFYILYLADKQERSPEEMAKMTGQVKEKVKQIEISRKQQDTYVKIAEELKNKSKIEVFYDRIPN